MPFGLYSAPATFQRNLDQIIGPDMKGKASAYQDDIVILGKTREEYFDSIKEVLKRLESAKLKINKEKSTFFYIEIRYLGHVNEKGIQTDSEKVTAITKRS